MVSVNGRLVARDAATVSIFDRLAGQGFVSSCNATNFFCVYGDEVLTSSGDFTLEHAYSAQEAFVTGTSGGLTSVREIDGKRLPGWLPGAVTQRLHYEALKVFRL